MTQEETPAQVQDNAGDASDAKLSSSRYRQVALDVATRIVNGQFKIGEKVYSRSLIASQYAVSAETARRAIALLFEMGIVETMKGSGVVILSQEKAALFVKRYGDSNTLAELKKTAMRQVERVQQEAAILKNAISTLAERADVFRSISPFTPFEAVLPPGSPCIGRRIADLDFWRRTGGTIVAIQQGDDLTVSPDPGTILQEQDILYFVGGPATPGETAALLQEEYT